MIHKAFGVIGERVLIIDVSENKTFNEKTVKGFEELLKSFGRKGLVIADTKRSIQKQKFGIFLESETFMTDLYGGRASLDFIEPMYNPSSLIEELAKGKIPKEGVFYNDGNFEVYDKYKEPLRSVGFFIK